VQWREEIPLFCASRETVPILRLLSTRNSVRNTVWGFGIARGGRAMFKTILVPLDGSANSEHSLAIAVSLAKRSSAVLRLVHVREPMPERFGIAAPPKEQDYLDLLAWKIRQTEHLSTYATVLEGPVAPTIAEHAISVNASLIVMTSHGRGPFSRFWLGGVADQLIRLAPAPLIVVRPSRWMVRNSPSRFCIESSNSRRFIAPTSHCSVLSSRFRCSLRAAWSRSR
jgi:nucleotide-binding universal stress UspA family protein